MISPLLALALTTSITAPASARVDAVDVSVSSAVRLSGEPSTEAWQSVQPTAAFRQREPKRRRRADRADRVPCRLRCDDAVRAGAGVRHPSRQDHHISHAARQQLARRLGAHHDRLVPRSPQRLRVRRQPVRRQDGPLLVQRQQQRRQLGCGLGRQRVTRRARLVGRVPDSVLAAALQPVEGEHVRLCRIA